MTGWVAAGLAAAPFVGLALLGRTFVLLDVQAEHGALQAVVSRCLAADPGSPPLWNPAMFCGMPLLADPQALVLYPPALLYRVLPFGFAVMVYDGFHAAVAAAGMVTWFRSSGVAGAPAVAGAVGYGLGGLVWMLAATPACLAPLAWLPWIVAASVAGGWRTLAVPAAWLALAGQPQFVLYGMAASLLAAGPGVRHRWRPLAAGWAAGLGCAGAVLVPAVAWLPYSARFTGVPVAPDDALRPDHLLSYALPVAFRDLTGDPVLANRDLWPTFNTIGTLPLLVLLAGLPLVWNASARPAMLMVAAGVLLALGPNLPVVGPWLHGLPPFSWVRRSALWMAVANLGLCRLAAGSLACRSARRPGIAVLVAGATWMELVAVGRVTQPTLPAAWAAAPSAEERWLAARRREGWFRVFTRSGHVREGMTPGRDAREALAHQRASLWPNLPALAGFDDADGVSPLRPARAFTPDATPDSGTLARLGVRYVIDREPGGPAPVFRDWSTIRPVPGASPGARVEPAAAGRIVRVDFARPGRIGVTAVLGRPASIDLAETWAPGWTNDDAGGPAIERGRDGLISVRLPAGRHELRLSYRPASVTAGFLLSAVSLAILIVSRPRR